MAITNFVLQKLLAAQTATYESQLLVQFVYNYRIEKLSNALPPVGAQLGF